MLIKNESPNTCDTGNEMRTTSVIVVWRGPCSLWLGLLAGKVGDRGLVSRSGIQISKEQMGFSR